MGHLRYLSTVKHVSGIVGNSSSGIIEAPSLKTGTINIGDRQKGRVRAESVIDCSPDIEDIDAAIQMLFSENFQRKLEECTNPYGDGDVSSKILEILRKTSLKDLMKKQFHDLEVSGSRL